MYNVPFLHIKAFASLYIATSHSYNAFINMWGAENTETVINVIYIRMIHGFIDSEVNVVWKVYQ